MVPLTAPTANTGRYTSTTGAVVPKPKAMNAKVATIPVMIVLKLKEAISLFGRTLPSEVTLNMLLNASTRTPYNRATPNANGPNESCNGVSINPLMRPV